VCVCVLRLFIAAHFLSDWVERRANGARCWRKKRRGRRRGEAVLQENVLASGAGHPSFRSSLQKRSHRTQRATSALISIVILLEGRRSIWGGAGGGGLEQLSKNTYLLLQRQWEGGPVPCSTSLIQTTITHTHTIMYTHTPPALLVSARIIRIKPACDQTHTISSR